jgi:hypothetical protein
LFRSSHHHLAVFAAHVPPVAGFSGVQVQSVLIYVERVALAVNPTGRRRGVQDRVTSDLGPSIGAKQ